MKRRPSGVVRFFLPCNKYEKVVLEFPPRGCRTLLGWVYVHTCICYFSAFNTSYDIYFCSRMHSRLSLAVARSHKLYGVALVYSRTSGKLERSELPPFRRTTSRKQLLHLPIEPTRLDPTFCSYSLALFTWLRQKSREARCRSGHCDALPFT